MIRVRDVKVFRSTKGPQITINLRGAVDRHEVLVKIARALKTTHSETVDGTSLDYFVDVVSDWIRENLPSPPSVIILDERQEKNDVFLAKIVACMHQAMMMALSQRFQDQEDFDFLKEVRAVCIDFYV